MYKRLKNENGITLIALVITIIILLILAGITINTISNTGLFSKAEMAKKEYQKATVDEQIELFKYELEFDKNETLKSKMIKAGLIDEKEINSNGLAKINNNENFLALSSYNGLQKLCDESESGNIFTGKTIYLINDIDCGASYDGNTGELLSGESFEPIKEFNGILDGNNYEIKNIYINKNNSEDKFVALFGILGAEGVIKNVTISNSYIKGYEDTSAFVGGNYGQLINCTNNCTIYGGSLTGGIAGRNYNTIVDCVNKGNIITTGVQTGGIVGNCDFGNPVIVKNCKNYGNITSDSTYIGGIVGGAWRGNTTNKNVDVIISDCQNYGNIGGTESSNNQIGGIVGQCRGTVKNCKNYAEIKGYGFIGGIVGVTNYYNNAGSLIENSKNYGNINGKDQRVGGICGQNSGGKILNCANKGNVTLDGENTYFGVGGIAGFGGSGYNDTYIEKCYNEGTVTLELSNSRSTQVAGIVGNLGMAEGSSYTGYVTDCYNKGKVVCNGNGSSFSPTGIGAWGRNVVVKNCYNIGSLISSNPKDEKGAIWALYNISCNIKFENNYWLNTCGGNCGISTGKSDIGAEAKTVSELKSLARVLGDSYAQDDKINDGFPYLIDNKIE